MSEPEKHFTIQRYDPVQHFDQGGSTYGDVVKEPDGDFIRYEDFERFMRDIDDATFLEDGWDHIRTMVKRYAHPQTVCPKCGSTNTERQHVSSPPAHTETDFWACDDCHHQWDHQ